MFPFRQPKPPSKLELAKKGVSDVAHTLIDVIPTEQIEEKFEDLKKGAAAAATAASVAAHHAGEAAAHKLGELHSVAAHLGEGVSSAGQSAAAIAAAKVGAATQSVRGTAHGARETLGEKTKSFASLKERAAHDLEIGGKEALHAKKVAQKAAEREAAALKARAAAAEAKKAAKLLEKEADAAQKDADETASQAKQAAADAVAEATAIAAAKAAAEKAEFEAEKEAKEEARERAEAKERAISVKAAKKLRKAEEKAHAEAEKAAEKAKSVISDHEDAEIRLAEVQVADGGSKLGWIIIGLALGAVLVFFFRPTSGRRSRAAIKDRLGKVSDGAVDAVTATADKVVDIAQRVEGLTHKVEAKLAADGETDDDTTIADRVRSTLGHHDVAKTIERLNIDCVDGIVTLRGPMLDEATQQILVTAVKTIPGVKDVVADFLTEEEPLAPQNSVI